MFKRFTVTLAVVLVAGLAAAEAAAFGAHSRVGAMLLGPSQMARMRMGAEMLARIEKRGGGSLLLSANMVS